MNEEICSLCGSGKWVLGDTQGMFPFVMIHAYELSLHLFAYDRSNTLSK